MGLGLGEGPHREDVDDHEGEEDRDEHLRAVLPDHLQHVHHRGHLLRVRVRVRVRARVSERVRVRVTARGRGRVGVRLRVHPGGP